MDIGAMGTTKPLDTGEDLEDVLEATVSELIATFRESIIVLVTIAERAKMSWRDEPTHPDWDAIQAAHFSSFVSNPIAADSRSVVGQYRLAPYDIDTQTYDQLSWLSIADHHVHNFAFVRFVTRHEPFDYVQLIELDDNLNSTRQTLEFPWGEGTVFNLNQHSRSSLRIVENICALE